MQSKLSRIGFVEYTRWICTMHAYDRQCLWVWYVWCRLFVLSILFDGRLLVLSDLMRIWITVRLWLAWRGMLGLVTSALLRGKLWRTGFAEYTNLICLMPTCLSCMMWCTHRYPYVCASPKEGCWVWRAFALLRGKLSRTEFAKYTSLLCMLINVHYVPWITWLYPMLIYLA